MSKFCIPFFTVLLIFHSFATSCNVYASTLPDAPSETERWKLIEGEKGRNGQSIRDDEWTEPLPPFGWKRLRYDMKYFFTAPSRIAKNDMQKMLLLTGITGALFIERKDIREFVQRNKTDSRMKFYEDARISSRGLFAPTLALVFLTSGKARGNDYDVETSQIIMESFSLSALSSGIGSFLIASERPEDGDGVKFFRTDGHGVSLDVALSASFIFPIIDRYLRVSNADSAGKKIWKRTSQVLIFSLPVFTAFQRMSADKHWAPDVFLGALVGLSTGKILSNAHGNHRSSKGECSISGGMLTVRF